eukprot:11744069-Karenia_brevis.AAC.1
MITNEEFLNGPFNSPHPLRPNGEDGIAKGESDELTMGRCIQLLVCRETLAVQSIMNRMTHM